MIDCFQQIRRAKEETIASGQWPAEQLPGTSNQDETPPAGKKVQEEDDEDEDLC